MYRVRIRLLPRHVGRRSERAAQAASRREAAGRRPQPDSAAEAAAGGAAGAHRHRPHRRAEGHRVAGGVAPDRRADDACGARGIAGACASSARRWPKRPAHVGDPAVRNRGTIGGNVAHADPASDLPTVLTALGARFVVIGPARQPDDRRRTFFTGHDGDGARRARYADGDRGAGARPPGRAWRTSSSSIRRRATR